MSPYEAVLRDAYSTLDSRVRRAHLAPLVAIGTCTVERGVHPVARLLARLLGLPAAGPNQQVQLDVAPDGDELVWTRRIGIVGLRTRQRAEHDTIVERRGPGSIAFHLTNDDASLVYRQASFSVAGVPIPSCLAPQVSARVSPTPEGWHVAVTVLWRAHVVCRYAARMVAG